MYIDTRNLPESISPDGKPLVGDFSSIAGEIAARLGPIEELGIAVESIPDTIADLSLPMPEYGAVLVRYERSQFGDVGGLGKQGGSLSSPGQQQNYGLRQLETQIYRITVGYQRNQGSINTGVIFRIIQLLLLGFKPTAAYRPAYFMSGQIDAADTEAQIWIYSLLLAVPVLVVGNVPDIEQILLRQIKLLKSSDEEYLTVPDPTT